MVRKIFTFERAAPAVREEVVDDFTADCCFTMLYDTDYAESTMVALGYMDPSE